MDEGRVVTKIWGEEVYITNRPEFCSKWLYISPGYVCSLHYHPKKAESFHVVAGSGVIVVGSTLWPVSVGETLHVPRGTPHCFATLTGMTLLEVSTQHSDEDVCRINESHALDPVADAKLWWTMP